MSFSTPHYGKIRNISSAVFYFTPYFWETVCSVGGGVEGGGVKKIKPAVLLDNETV